MPDLLRNSVNRRTHKERAQPYNRKKFGLLEKKKDYQLRARDFHRKQDKLKELKKKASFRNPDEFYFKMNSTKTKDGIHTVARDNTKSFEDLKSFKKQDLGYLAMKSLQETKKIDRLQASLQGIDGMDDLDRPNKRVIFVESAAEAKAKAQALSKKEVEDSAEDPAHARFKQRIAEKLEKQRLKGYAELEARCERKQALDSVVSKLQTQKNLMGKGVRTKQVVLDKFGEEDKSKTTYKWKLERKK